MQKEKLRLPLLSLLALVPALGLAFLGTVAYPQSAALASVENGFAHPPDNARIMMRWWWFGPAVTKPELRRELENMKAGGIGGAEIQPVYPMDLDDPALGFRNLPYLSPDFLSSVSYAAETPPNESSQAIPIKRRVL